MSSTTQCLPRGRQNYLDVISSLRVETDQVYAPGHLGDGLTWCNLFLHDATKALSCAVPFLKANKQVEWLASIEGAGEGWWELTAEICPKGIELAAMIRANSGFPTVAVWANPIPERHGHVAMVVPPKAPNPVPSTKPITLYIAQAGAHNFENVPLARGFGTYAPRLFTHA